ncbi:MAG: diaminopimelate decarboxylase, partial [Muribaculaceae bacterium]|nr:diaminopimelate decarboxylase [Muribaculaceae bacterium]
LIRPALYQARHAIQLTGDDITGRPMMRYDVVGPICESSDVFDTDVELPELKRGDILAIRSAGAYGEIMASQYNMRPLPGAILD